MGGSDKLKVAYIGMAGAIVAALISGAALYLSQRGHQSKPPIATSNSRVVINVPPAAPPPAQPTLQTFQASVFNLLNGQ